MPHQFTVGDIVRLNGTEQESEVKGFAENGKYLLVSPMPTHPRNGRLYLRADDVTLVRAAGQGEPSHPQKIETVISEPYDWEHIRP